MVGVVIVALITIAGLAMVAMVASQQAKITPTNQDQTAIINLRGKIVCLPKKDTSGPQTEECAYGLQISETIHYALTNLNEEGGGDPSNTGDLVIVTGTLSPPAAEEIYDVAGTIDVQAIRVQ